MNRLREIYKKYYKKEFEEYTDNFYPICDFFNQGWTITWCPFCEKQSYVFAVSFEWWFHEKCGCTFSKVTNQVVIG